MAPSDSSTDGRDVRRFDRIDALARVRGFSVILIGLGCAVGCKASVEADAHTGTEGSELDKPLTVSMSAPDSGAGQAPDTALLGARQDLGYRGPPTATCSCLAVALGAPNDPAFHWSGPIPKTDPNSELVIAVTSQGQNCPAAAPQSLGASYWGYEVVGSDVVVVVEPAMPGRPIASGAIIPRPVSGGNVYVQPSASSVPYGRGPNEASRCQIPVSTASAPAAAVNFGSTPR